MKNKKWAILVIVALFIVTSTGCFGSKKNDDFSEISKSLAQHSNQLKDELGVTLVGYAADPKENVFKIGIGYDSALTEIRLKQIIEEYLSNSVSTIQGSDWHQRLKPYNLIIERIGDVKTNFPILAHKNERETDLTWVN
ncbi:hypothetical protein [Paenibacillus cremeus]|uniref:Uncharacterized protein n=1 Tax=Paenibacillus cremeus TaxID=2163881 RepID=A0A559KH19_9BACL|nr:hypothetical protein [Paenibacillus cremeus]TVY11433.1 hypothetical protein FPZ49_04195 [Paenibacillus cremeus]